MKYTTRKKSLQFYLLLMIVLAVSQFFTVVEFAQSASVKISPKPDSTLSNTYWKAVEINGSFVSLGAGKKELHLVLHDSKKQVNGFSGCNNFKGGFKHEKQQITFGPMAATMMACLEGMEQEQQFFQALEKAKRFSISGENLVFYDEEDHALLRFNAVYLQ